jgi:hypothetical protein
MRRMLFVAVVVAATCALPSPARAKDSVDQLRARGPAALAELLARYDRTPPASLDRASMERLIDAVAAQKDAVHSRLFWYTAFDQARQAAAREGKPILYLRLLGRLDQELSCANSRFFRTTLYPDPAVNSLLREKFVLVWQSERPVPVVTVDFGDGRVLKRTVTGNSIHYILDSQGNPVDALPGLCAAKSFVEHLNRAAAVAADVAKQPAQREEILRAYHRDAIRATDQAWTADLAKAQLPATLTAGAADDAAWQKLAMLHQAEVAFSPEVRLAIAAKAPPADKAMPLARSKAFVETPLMRMIARLQVNVAQDTVRNEYTMHRRLHEWLAATPSVALAPLNERVYAELFLTPRSDPWLGLAPADGFAAIDESAPAAAPR